MHLPSSFLYVSLLCFSELASCFSHSFKLHRREVDPVTIVDIDVLAARRDAVEHKYAPVDTLQKRDTRSSSEVLVDLIELEKESIALSGKYGRNVRLEKRAAPVKHVPLIDVVQKTGYSVDLLYQVEVSIGTPPQSMLLQIDTGSSDLWVASAQCRACNTSSNVLFETSRSSSFTSFKSSTEIVYATGSVSCNKASDFISISGIGVQNQTFGECTDQLDVLYPASIGILGLGFPANSKTSSATWIQNAYSQGQIPAPVFAMKLGSAATNSPEATNVLTIGGYDSSAFTGAINWVPGISSLHFSVPFDGITVGGNSLFAFPLGEQMNAIVDSGATIISGPPDAVKAFYGLVPSSKETSDGSGIYTFPCTNSMPRVAFTFGGVAYPIQPADLIRGYADTAGKICVGAIVAGTIAADGTGGLAWLLGDSFLKSVYTIFDLGENRVGFAKKTNNAAVTGRSSILPLEAVTGVASGTGTLIATYTGLATTQSVLLVTQQSITTRAGTSLPTFPAVTNRATGIQTLASTSVEIHSTSPTTEPGSIEQPSSGVSASSIVAPGLDTRTLLTPINPRLSNSSDTGEADSVGSDVAVESALAASQESSATGRSQYSTLLVLVLGLTLVHL